MAYPILEKVYYADRANYEALYRERFSGDYTHHIDFTVAEAPAFFVTTPEIQARMLSIRKLDKRIFSLCQALPDKAISQFSIRCLIDEILLTNNIEGVHSTRREINGVLDALERPDRRIRFHGLVRKYLALQGQERLPLETCEDIRRIYDELVLAEVVEADPENAPDGVLFRKCSVSVESRTQKEIHRGLYPEAAISAAMKQALSWLHREQEDPLYRAAVFHYLLGYIHPFYDGNGRLNRFISSYLLTRELEPVLAYRLSYTINQNIDKYYNAFKICNHPLNRGDLTPFVSMFLEIVDTSAALLAEALEKRKFQLQHYLDLVPRLPGGADKKCSELYLYLIQAELFSEQGISTRELLGYLELGRDTLRKRLAVIETAGLLRTTQIGNEKFYGLDLTAADHALSH